LKMRLPAGIVIGTITSTPPITSNVATSIRNHAGSPSAPNASTWPDWPASFIAPPPIMASPSSRARTATILDCFIHTSVDFELVPSLSALAGPDERRVDVRSQHQVEVVRVAQRDRWINRCQNGHRSRPPRSNGCELLVRTLESVRHSVHRLLKTHTAAGVR